MYHTQMQNKQKHKTTIQLKLILVFLFTTVLLFAVNFLVYLNTNQLMEQIDKIYVSNVNLNDMQDRLFQIQSNMTDFLNTKSTDSMESYYRSEQEYRNMLESLNKEIKGNNIQLTEKNIYAMSEGYLNLTDHTVDAKRGRNIEKYKTSYEDASRLYAYINTYLYSLNNEQFKNNSSNYRALLDSLRYSEIANMSVLIIAALLNSILIVILTKGITDPLKKLAETADKVAEGNLDVALMEVKSNDEVGVVTKAFNQMLLSIREYLAQVRESMELERELKEKELIMETHLKDAQLKYLQAQINPHFLFNTLNAGVQLAMMENADRTYTYIQNVSDFFRYNIRKNNERVTLEEELKLVDSYVYILNVRFSGDIDFRKEIEEGWTKIQVPSMILQPIVENAVNYGIRDIDRKGIIELSVKEKEAHICISIRDNGIGMSQEKIKRIMEGSLEKSELGDASNGVGLDNVINRLKLFYGREDVITFISEGENKGTEVTIYIPK